MSRLRKWSSLSNLCPPSASISSTSTSPFILCHQYALNPLLFSSASKLQPLSPFPPQSQCPPCFHGPLCSSLIAPTALYVYLCDTSFIHLFLYSFIHLFTQPIFIRSLTLGKILLQPLVTEEWEETRSLLPASWHLMGTDRDKWINSIKNSAYCPGRKTDIQSMIPSAHSTSREHKPAQVKRPPKIFQWLPVVLRIKHNSPT